MTREQYLAYVAPRIVLDSLKRNLLPSPRISQACFEPSYGTSELAVKAKNLFGVKVNDQWEGKFYNKVSGECYNGKDYEAKASDFQAYDSWEDSIIWQGWYLENRCTTPKYHPELKHYAELIGNRDYKDCARILQEKKYGTSPEYAQRVIKYIELHNLTKYDSMTREEAEAMIKAEGESKKMIINVHAGHNPDGKVACGAVGLIKESTEARKVKDEVITQLRQLGHTVYDCTVNNGTSKEDVLRKIVKICNEHKADLDVSIHFNCSANDKLGNGKTTGTEVFLYSNASRAYDYAEGVCKAFELLGFKNRGIKYNPSLYVLRNTNAPAMLVEVCFVDDKDDVELYDYKSVAEAIVYGITGQYVQEEPEEEPDNKEEYEETAVGVPDKLYRIQVGAYGVKKNAENMAKRLKEAGFDCFITQV